MSTCHSAAAWLHFGNWCGRHKRDAEEDDEVSFTIGDHESLVSAERLERRRASRSVNATEKPASASDDREDKENLCDVLFEFPRR